MAITRPWHEWTEHQALLGKGFSAPVTPAVFGPFFFFYKLFPIGALMLL